MHSYYPDRPCAECSPDGCFLWFTVAPVWEPPRVAPEAAWTEDDERALNERDHWAMKARDDDGGDDDGDADDQ